MPGCHRSSRFVAPLAAALLLSSTLLGGCYGGRSTIPSGPQRISEAEGRKTRQEREAAEEKALAAQAAAEQKAANERAEADRALLEKKIAAEQAAQQKKAAEAKVLAEKLALEKKAAEQAKAAEAKSAADQATLDKTVAEADKKVAEAHATAQGGSAEKKTVVAKAPTAATVQPDQPTIVKSSETTKAVDKASIVKTAADKAAMGEPKKVVVQSAPPPATKTTPGAVAASSLEVAKAPANAPAAKQESASATVAAASADKPAKPYVAYVQIASFTSRANADAAAAWLKAHGYASARVVDVEQGDMALHRVQTGPYQDPVATHKALDELKINWPQSFIPAD